MTRNFSISTISSKLCFGGCGRTIFWNDQRHYYADTPTPDGIKHFCEGSKPSETKRESIFEHIKVLQAGIDKHKTLLQEIVLKIDLLVELNEEVAKLRKSVWLITQKLDSLELQVSKNAQE